MAPADPGVGRPARHACAHGLSGKSLPVHCVVEAVCSVERSKRPSAVETDSYVIIPAATALDDLVAVALAQLGYARDTAAAATGAVVINNWKPLSFDKIADGPLVSVGDILGELTTVATLRIQIFRSRPGVLADMRDKLLRLLLTHSRALLLNSGCPLDEVTLTQLCRGAGGAAGGADRIPEPPEEVRRKFEHWWSVQLQQQQQQPPAATHRQQSAQQPPQTPQTPQPQPPLQQPRRTPSPRHRSHLSLSPAAGLSLYGSGADGALGRGGHPPLGAGHAGPLGAGVGALDAVALSHKLMHDVHPALQTVQSQYPTPKTRMRTSFDPELELPKLQRWFAENQHPSRQQIQQYVRELNSLESRRGRKPLDVNNVVYWFKNARAAQKRAEIRSTGPGGHYMPQNGYGSNSHSPPGSGGAPHFLSPETLLTEGPHAGHGAGHGPAVGPGGRLLPMGSMGGPMGGMGMGMPPWPLSSPPMAHMHRAPHADLPRPHSVVSDESDGEGGGPGGPGGSSGGGPPAGQQDDADSHGDRNSPLSLIINREDKEDKDKEREDARDDKDNKESDLDVTTEDCNMSIKQEPGAGDDDAASTGHNNNNNNHVKDCEAMSDMDEDEDDEDDGSEGAGGVSELQQQQQQQLERYHQHQQHGFRSPSPCGPPCGPGGLPFPMFGHSIMYMSQYLPGLAAAHPQPPPPPPQGQQPPQQPPQGLNLSASDERRKRNRTFIDPVSEVPRLEQWFKHHTHPPHSLILKYTEELNHMPYRCKFPRLEPKNVQFWFKNRRAKDKRMKVSLFDNGPQANHQQGVYVGQHGELMLKREGGCP
ncbi:hypothetical protein ONE63_007957 [Megalurothrips usitatus]|uniref:DNA-binding protein SATB2 n=1 Tax=Megalurothrips usitatus TaxID=439358 RepID=A0AAV7XTI0_9NEOP|nr:hypothetical protein ONE63_007957 [Megalurothrips usitatus]